MSQEISSDRAAAAIRRRALGIVAGGALLAPAILSVRAAPAAAQAQGAVPTAYDLISSSRTTTIFADVIKTHGLEAEFRAPGRFGFFVPLDSAVERLPALQVERFRRDKELARKTVLNHITDYSDPINALVAFQEGSWDTRRLKTRAGYTLTLVTGGGQPRIGGHTILYTNIPAANGYCHGLDGVLEIER
jgi:uncharacterized surface protein with fasciclin (FAS1) repeats